MGHPFHQGLSRNSLTVGRRKNHFSRRQAEAFQYQSPKPASSKCQQLSPVELKEDQGLICCERFATACTSSTTSVATLDWRGGETHEEKSGLGQVRRLVRMSEVSQHFTVAGFTVNRSAVCCSEDRLASFHWSLGCWNADKPGCWRRLDSDQLAGLHVRNLSRRGLNARRRCNFILPHCGWEVC